MTTKNINKLVRMMETYLTEHPELFNYSEYNCPEDVIVRLDETFNNQYVEDPDLYPDRLYAVREACKVFLDKHWNTLNDRITIAGGNSFDNRDTVTIKDPVELTFMDELEMPLRRMSDPKYAATRDFYIRESPYLVDELSFTFCTESGETKHMHISLDYDRLYLKKEIGLKGLFFEVCGENTTRYIIPDKESFSRKINGLNIYKWPKSFPTDYVPSEHLIGCDQGTWGLTYKEIGKKTTRHIYGKGAFPISSPYVGLLRILNKVDPDHEIMNWVMSHN